MGRFPAGKFKLWIGQPVNAPFVTPPVSLRLMIVPCILSVTFALGYGVFSQLGHTGFEAYSGPIIGIAVFSYFVLPIALAVSISTNRAISRPLTLLYFCSLAYPTVILLGRMELSREVGAFALLAITLLLLSIAWWLYRSPKLRVYYALITGTPIPEDLAHSIDELTSPGQVEKSFSRISKTVAPYFEIAVGVIILGALVYAISLTG